MDYNRIRAVLYIRRSHCSLLFHSPPWNAKRERKANPCQTSQSDKGLIKFIEKLLVELEVKKVQENLSFRRTT